MDLVLASRNVHKIREFRDILRIPDLDLLSLLQFPELQLVEETGSSFEENAILKAEYTAKALSSWVLADDSGLVIPALHGEPGIHSRSYAGKHATDKENRQKLLKALEGYSHLERAAYYQCVLVLANPDGVQKVVTGYCEGVIVHEERGSNGFGYDSVFMKYDYDATFGELDDVKKNLISHRRKALDKLIITLEQLVNKENAISR